MADTTGDGHYSFDDFVSIIERLRAKDGCPWDREQTHESLRPYLLEEAYEAIDAINQKDMANLKEELGDCLLQIVFHSIIAQEEAHFSVQDVLDTVATKMIRRHPHVFGNTDAKTPDAVLKNWSEIKKAEKGQNSIYDVIRQSTPKTMPGLMRAQKVLKKSDQEVRNFDEKTQNIFHEINVMLDKWQRFSDNNTSCDQSALVGDLLLKIAKLSNIYHINLEFALTNAIETFINKHMGL